MGSTDKLSSTFLKEFTDSPTFFEVLDKVLRNAVEKIVDERGQREDSLAATGLIGLSVHCREKSCRIFNKLASKRRSTEKLEHEIYDNLTYAILLVIYLEMLNASKTSPDK